MDWYRRVHTTKPLRHCAIQEPFKSIVTCWVGKHPLTLTEFQLPQEFRQQPIKNW